MTPSVQDRRIEQSFTERVRGLGVAGDDLLHRRVADICATSGPWTWAEIIAVAEGHIDGPLPDALLASIDTLGDLCDFVKVRASQRDGLGS